MKKLFEAGTYRILDANLNRATEGMRVCEEVARFILNDRLLTSKFKNMRHQSFEALDSIEKLALVRKRNILEDVGRNLLRGEMKRKNLQDIFFANMQRIKESVRVLEEFSKLLNINSAVKLKKIRYNAYELEKKITFKLSALSDIKQGFLPAE